MPDGSGPAPRCGTIRGSAISMKSSSKDSTISRNYLPIQVNHWTNLEELTSDNHQKHNSTFNTSNFKQSIQNSWSLLRRNVKRKLIICCMINVYDFVILIILFLIREYPIFNTNQNFKSSFCVIFPATANLGLKFISHMQFAWRWFDTPPIVNYFNEEVEEHATSRQLPSE